MKISLRDIYVEYNKKPLLNNLSIDFESNKIGCLLGRSGSGKTTILKIIAGINTHYQGSVYFDDINVNNIKPGKRKVGWIPQQQLLFPGLSVKQNILYGLVARGVAKEIQNKRLTYIVKLVGLEGIINRSTERLSGGEKQRTSIARALITEPEILLLDEPFSSLDAPERDRLTLSLREIQIQTGVTAIHVTHSPREAELIADKVYILSNGKILQFGDIQNIFKKPKNMEVAKLLSIPNVVEKGIKGINQPVIIPKNAVIIGNGKNYGKIIAITRKSIHIQHNDLILEVEKNNKEYTVGQIIKFNIKTDSLIKFE